jgi:SagB-type dehydrogenase family enzyme
MDSKNILNFFLLYLIPWCTAQAQETIRLLPPQSDRGIPVMQALALRASATEWDTVNLSHRDLSDLIWSANGINRAESGKRTAPSALNARDIDLYIFLKSGIYLYDAGDHMLILISKGDHRDQVAGEQQDVAKAPVIILMVSDLSRFSAGEETQHLEWAAIDAGTVSQNIALFCASEGLATRPRVTMNRESLKKLLNLKEFQHLILNNPVSY